MNVAELEAALPALTVALFTDVTSTAQVLVSDEPHAALRSDFHVLWRFLDDLPAPDAGGLGRGMHGLRYALEVRDGGATQAERRSWPLELRSGLHHRRKPVTVTGLDRAEVLRLAVAPAGAGVIDSGASGAILGEAEVIFYGDVLRDDQADAVVPSRLTGWVAGWDASDAAAFHLDDDAGVISWADVGRRYAVAQGTAALRPVRTAARQNARAGVVFTRASAHRLVANVAPVTAAAFTLVVVARSADAATLQTILQLVGSVVGEAFTLAFAGATALDPVRLSASTVADGAAAADTSVGYVADTACVITARVVAAASRAITIDGAGGGTSLVSRVPTVTQIVLGAQLDATDALGGDLYEFHLYEGDLDAGDLGGLEDALATKWGT